MLTKRQQNIRIAFASTHLNWPVEGNAKKWRMILWSDESIINMVGSVGKDCVRRPNNAEMNF